MHVNDPEIDERIRAEYLTLCLKHEDRRDESGALIDRLHPDYDPRRHCPSCRERMSDPAQGTYQVEECGCRIVGNGTLPQPHRILYCPDHQLVTKAAVLAEKARQREKGK